MTTARALYALTRADVLERVRRRSFLVVVGMAIAVAYSILNGTFSMRLDEYRGVYNSAWTGTMISVVGSTLLSLVCFYIVKNAVDRDRQTGVGQILATTPIRKWHYLLGKALSNFVVLAMIVSIMVVASVVLQMWKGEDNRLDVVALLAPFLFLFLPVMAVVAATAVLFETLPGLRGGFGNVVYFFVWTFALAFGISTGRFDILGFHLFKPSMQAAVLAEHPDYSGGILIGGDRSSEAVGTFLWNGIDWTPAAIGSRMFWVVVALGIVGLAALLFDRFDSAGKRSRWTWRSLLPQRDNAGPDVRIASREYTHLSPLAPTALGFRFVDVLVAELKLTIKGHRWWWYAGAVLLIAVGFANDAETARQTVLPFAWLWPVLLWSAMGAREARNNVEQFVFSAPRVIRRQLLACWAAGVVVALVAASGVAVRLLAAGDLGGLFALGAGAVFVPALALAFGVWSRGGKLFEAVYVALWYIGPINHTPVLDFVGATQESVRAGMPVVFLLSATMLLACAVAGRTRQMTAD